MMPWNGPRVSWERKLEFSVPGQLYREIEGNPACQQPDGPRKTSSYHDLIPVFCPHATYGPSGSPERSAARADSSRCPKGILSRKVGAGMGTESLMHGRRRVSQQGRWPERRPAARAAIAFRCGRSRSPIERSPLTSNSFRVRPRERINPRGRFTFAGKWVLALSLIQGRHPARRCSFSRGFSVAPIQRWVVLAHNQAFGLDSGFSWAFGESRGFWPSSHV